jgi:prepilin-type processing-associated H-X9-DG protein
MGDYVSKAVKSFVCPSDNYLFNAQKSLGWDHRLRSCAMNGALGDGEKWFGMNAAGTAYNPGHASMPQYYNAKKSSDLHIPGPSDVWVITDEHPNSNDDASLYVDPAQATGTGNGSFTELPGSMHASGATLVFADGHSEIHTWKDAQTTPKFDPSLTSYGAGRFQAVPVTNDKDLLWFAQHTPQY